MSLCPSSSHQLVAAAIAFRRARRKFPKDFGLESTVERESGNAKTETAPSREGPINQAKSSSSLVKRACNSRSDHVCPASLRNRDYDHSHSKENTISCSCCRTRNGSEDISELRDECSGGDAIDTVPSREFAASPADQKNEFARSAEQDRCDVTSRATDDGATKTAEWIPQSARSPFYHHRKARCPSKACSSPDPVNLPYDSALREKNDKVAYGDSSGDKGKQFASTSCHDTSIDLDGNAEGSVAGGCDSWTEQDVLTCHRKIEESSWRCQCERYSRKKPILDLLKSSCDHCCDGCDRHREHHHRIHACIHQHCCCQQRDHSITSAKKCETHERGISGGRAQHKSWRDQMRGENGRLCARQCRSKDCSGIISASRERNDEEERGKKEDDDDDNDDDDDDGVAVINHKDSMCILAEKYKAGGRCRAGRRCDEARSGDRTAGRDECDKSLTSEIIDQPESSLESANAAPHADGGPSVKHVCRAHCEGCGTAARVCSRGCNRHTPPEGEFDRLKSLLSETAAAAHRCSSRAPCRRAF